MELLVSRSLTFACLLAAFGVGCRGTASWGSDGKHKVKMATFTHHDADVNGIRLHYVTAGKGKLILFVHGFPEFWYAWRHQLTEFGGDFQAVALDMRGYNLSSKPADVSQYELKYLVEDVRALADHLGQKRFVLVGHDWGGVVAWLFAAAHPDYLEKLVIINAPHPAVFQRELRENPAQQKASQYMLMFRSPEAEATLSANHYAALVAGVLGEGLKKGYFTEEDRKAYLDAWSQPGALTGGLNYYRAARVGPPTAGGNPTPGNGEGARAEAPAIAGTAGASLVVKVPTLVIWGEKDQALLTGNLEGLDPFVPKLTIKRIPDGSHWVIHEQPARINTLLREFIAGSPAP
jgi:pimeloyl-ACP methyl ester carboxylesterase